MAVQFVILQAEIERVHNVKNTLLDEVNLWKEKCQNRVPVLYGRHQSQLLQEKLLVLGGLSSPDRGENFDSKWARYLEQQCVNQLGEVPGAVLHF